MLTFDNGVLYTLVYEKCVSLCARAISSSSAPTVRFNSEALTQDITRQGCIGTGRQGAGRGTYSDAEACECTTTRHSMVNHDQTYTFHAV